MKNKKIRAVSISLLLASMLLFASASVYTYYQIQMLGNIKAGLEDPLEAWSESSYIVWQYNSTFYASRNMSTNIIFYFGTNDDHAIQWSIDNCTAYGGSVYVKAATYTGTYNAAVVVKDKVTLVIERGALGITYTVDSGASPTILDYNHYTSDYNYLIFTVGDNYYAQSGTTGGMEFSGANASQIIQNILDVCTGGESLFFLSGTYSLDVYLTIKTNNISIEGEDRAGVVFQCSSHGFLVGVNPNGLSDVRIEHLTMKGIGSGGVIGVGVYNKSRNILLNDVHIDNFNYGFITIATDATVTFSNITIQNCFITNIPYISQHGAGIDVAHSDYVYIHNNYVSNLGSYGIKLGAIKFVEVCGNIIKGWGTYDEAANHDRAGIVVFNTALMNTSNVAIANNVLEITNTGTNPHAILISQERGGDTFTRNVAVTGNTIYGASDLGGHGIYLHACSGSGNQKLTEITVTGNTILNCYCGIAGSEPYGVIISSNTVTHCTAGILFERISNSTISSNVIVNNALVGLNVSTESLYNVIVGNICSDCQSIPTQDYGIWEGGGADYNIIIGCSAQGNTIANIRVNGANTKVNLCYNGTSWIA